MLSNSNRAWSEGDDSRTMNGDAGGSGLGITATTTGGGGGGATIAGAGSGLGATMGAGFGGSGFGASAFGGPALGGSAFGGSGFAGGVGGGATAGGSGLGAGVAATTGGDAERLKTIVRDSSRIAPVSSTIFTVRRFSPSFSLSGASNPTSRSRRTSRVIWSTSFSVIVADSIGVGLVILPSSRMSSLATVVRWPGGGRTSRRNPGLSNTMTLSSSDGMPPLLRIRTRSLFSPGWSFIGASRENSRTSRPYFPKISTSFTDTVNHEIPVGSATRPSRRAVSLSTRTRPPGGGRASRGGAL